MAEYLNSDLKHQIESSSLRLRADLERLSAEAGRIIEGALDPLGVRARVLTNPLSACSLAVVFGIVAARFVSTRSRGDAGRDAREGFGQGGVPKRALISRAAATLVDEGWAALSRRGKRAIWRAIVGGGF
jgi:hypothetical protein